MDQRLY